MFLINYLLPISKENPNDAVIKSHQLMIKSGMIHKVGSGVYSWLPIGLRVLHKVIDIIRFEMNNIGCLEVSTPSMQPFELWKKSGRHSDNGDLSAETLVAVDRHGNKLIYSPTAEEVFTELFGDCIKSYKNLPIVLYQISTKFRDEIRPRFGLMRGREFLMKDAYSFDIDQKNSLKNYENILKAYLKIFKQCELSAIPVLAPTGSIGGDYSHEFHIVSDTGESTIYYDSSVINDIENQNISLENLNSYYICEEEKHKYNNKKPINIKGELIETKSIEVGHIFHLGTKYSKSMNVKVQGYNGELFYPSMGCYGIGVSRLICAIIECYNDERGIIWPKKLAPFKVIIININNNCEKCDQVSTKIYYELNNMGFEPLYDNTDDSIGKKFARADLIGIPVQIVISTKNIKEDKIELKFRQKIESIFLEQENIINYIKFVLN
ncbi:proline--tRNA ligase [Lyticum sinuosum]|uniref:Proline--tRNA ligase n=1 Tax=Lyticum sinuosum TaxID=1332059 RepID=A0AAE5AH11_9RICK|nr:proline--tRNA ligase [Lyticum sinuosum]MDZ5761447.1 Proline--tRNA ligase [Lyticum sinuosum]